MLFLLREYLDRWDYLFCGGFFLLGALYHTVCVGGAFGIGYIGNGFTALHIQVCYFIKIILLEERNKTDFHSFCARDPKREIPTEEQ